MWDVRPTSRSLGGKKKDGFFTVPGMLGNVSQCHGNGEHRRMLRIRQKPSRAGVRKGALPGQPCAQRVVEEPADPSG